LLDPPGLGARPGGLDRGRLRLRPDAALRRENREERVDDPRIELRSGASLELCQRRLARERAAVRAIGRHRAPGVARADDARDERDVLTGQPVGIAVSVPVLVTGPDDRSDLAEQPSRTLEHLL